MANDKSTKFAVIRINNEQLKVEEGGVYEIKKIDQEIGSEIKCSDVLMVVDGDKVQVGKPLVDGAVVTYTVKSQFKGDKIDVFKYKAKARYRRSYGARALLTRIEIKSIKA